MAKRCSRIIGFLAVFASVAMAQDARGVADAVASINKVLADAVTRGDIPGVVAMATDRRGVIYQGAFGLADAATGRSLTADDIFRIASMTKPVASVAAMQLIEQGRLQLDDPAEKYLPELTNLKIIDKFDARTGEYAVRPATKTLTVRHLLTHTAGIGYDFTSTVVRDFKPRNGEQYAVGPLLFEPGQQWLYGSSTNWVGRLVETITGKTLDDYFRERIFAPAGMVDTYYNVPQQKQSRLVAVHRRRSDGSFEASANQPPASGITRFRGEGGLSSTAADYIRFLQMLLNGGELNGTRILAADTVRLMGANHIGSVGVPALKSAVPERSSDFTFVADGRDKWGLGFLITADPRSGKRSAGSLSWGGINNTYFWVDPARGVAGVILMQFLPFADSRALAVHDAFERGVYQLASRTGH